MKKEVGFGVRSISRGTDPGIRIRTQNVTDPQHWYLPYKRAYSQAFFSCTQDPLGEFTSENMSSFERLLVHALSAYNALNSYSKMNTVLPDTVDKES